MLNRGFSDGYNYTTTVTAWLLKNMHGTVAVTLGDIPLAWGTSLAGRTDQRVSPPPDNRPYGMSYIFGCVSAMPSSTGTEEAIPSLLPCVHGCAVGPVACWYRNCVENALTRRGMGENPRKNLNERPCVSSAEFLPVSGFLDVPPLEQVVLLRHASSPRVSSPIIRPARRIHFCRVFAVLRGVCNCLPYTFHHSPEVETYIFRQPARHHKTLVEYSSTSSSTRGLHSHISSLARGTSIHPYFAVSNSSSSPAPSYDTSIITPRLVIDTPTLRHPALSEPLAWLPEPSHSPAPSYEARKLKRNIMSIGPLAGTRSIQTSSSRRPTRFARGRDVTSSSSPAPSSYETASPTSRSRDVDTSILCHPPSSRSLRSQTPFRSIKIPSTIIGNYPRATPALARSRDDDPYIFCDPVHSLRLWTRSALINLPSAIIANAVTLPCDPRASRADARFDLIKLPSTIIADENSRCIYGTLAGRRSIHILPFLCSITHPQFTGHALRRRPHVAECALQPHFPDLQKSRLGRRRRARQREINSGGSGFQNTLISDSIDGVRVPGHPGAWARPHVRKSGRVENAGKYM
ncbi:hypothetical protein DFP72DRAFT_1044801 [Ephemerocybe angulata]|uniref:Uncharacterized protein n=1 Tax=Ephemerocybe angulata TaxID=980116 RepID=A0A8H6M6J8_9AGAR|nr:hypothetical protein DFP72DRAFT_1044801 [Tulosesus angulatus]